MAEMISLCVRAPFRRDLHFNPKKHVGKRDVRGTFSQIACLMHFYEPILSPGYIFRPKQTENVR